MDDLWRTIVAGNAATTSAPTGQKQRVECVAGTRTTAAATTASRMLVPTVRTTFAHPMLPSTLCSYNESWFCHAISATDPLATSGGNVHDERTNEAAHATPARTTGEASSPITVSPTTVSIATASTTCTDMPVRLTVHRVEAAVPLIVTQCIVLCGGSNSAHFE